MAGDSSVRGFVFVIAVGGNEHGRHHGERAVSGGDHVAHHVAVVILASPDKAAARTHDARHGVVDERIEIFYARLFEFFLIFVFVDLGKDVLKGVVVSLGDGVLGGEPYVLFDVERVIKAAAREARDALFGVMHAEHYAAACGKIEDLYLAPALFVFDHELCLSALAHLALHVAVDVAVSMPCHGDGACPTGNVRLDTLDENGRAEDRSVQDRPDRAVGAFPHTGKVIFLHALGVGGYRGAFHADAVFCDS